MLQRQPGLIRTTSLILAASLALLLIISSLYQHFQGALSDWKAPSTATSTTTSPRWTRNPYVATNEIQPQEKTPPERTVHIGLHIENIYNLSLKDRTFNMEGWYWLKWPEKVNTIKTENNITDQNMIHFENQVYSDTFALNGLEPMPKKLEEGIYYQRFHISGSFYIKDLQLHAFPFDDLQLPIVMELGPKSFSCQPGNSNGCFSLKFDKNSNAHSLGQDATINGYTLIGTESREYVHQYETSFGIKANEIKSAVQTNIYYQTDFSASFWLYIFPLLILIGISIASPSLPASLGDARLAIPTTILLTLIFLQIGYKAGLPSLEYVSYLDWIYIYAYIIAALLFLLFCWSTNAHTTACASGREAQVVHRIQRVDGLVQGVAVAGLLLVLGSGLFFQP